ncbi:hypothetical protein CIHG_10453 [Coccidioides immitis H538.4]|uniref:Uncharacterized protein n=2 Tax=Coccidioides immitis TaxID=5501 RepID=A0A0J8UXG3_COCIT|nr:hypothetical protein CIRG_06380 [Coccidioides immitis RMSCC 2394]KMU92618.1 hypothetical protein CIHG_10453 [Coccidioides immitis H538.4]
MEACGVNSQGQLSGIKKSLQKVTKSCVLNHAENNGGFEHNLCQNVKSHVRDFASISS